MNAEPNGLLDTTTVILIDGIDPAGLPSQPAISSITLAELSLGPLATGDRREQAKRQARLQVAENAFDALHFDASAHALGRMVADLRRHGRKTTARAYDSLMAAIAAANDLPPYTGNPRDFIGISDPTVVPIPHPDSR